MAHKKKDAPRKLYARAKVPFICYAGQYFAPELREKGAIKVDGGDITVEEVKDDEGNLVALDATQGDLNERLTPFTFERKQRAQKDEDAPTETDNTETVEADSNETVIVGDESSPNDEDENQEDQETAPLMSHTG